MSKRKHDENTENADTQNRLSYILKSLATDENALAKKLCESIRTLQEGNQTQVRALCKQWDVEPSVEGKRRGMAEIKADLYEKLKNSCAQYIKDGRISIHQNSYAHYHRIATVIHKTDAA